MTESIDWVNSIRANMQNFINDPKNKNSPTYPETISKINALDSVLSENIELLAENNKLKLQLRPLDKDLGDLSDLPPSLVKELLPSNQNTLDNQAVEVINSYGGEADITQIMVGLYRKFKVEKTRRYMQNFLWRLTKKDMAWSVKGVKGLYTTTKPQEDPEHDTSPDNDMNGSSHAFDSDLDDEIPF